MTNKWRILRNRLSGSQAISAKILLCCATLHNYCIDLLLVDDDASSSLPSVVSGDFVIRAAPVGLAYLLTVDEVEDELRENAV